MNFKKSFNQFFFSIRYTFKKLSTISRQRVHFGFFSLLFALTDPISEPNTIRKITSWQAIKIKLLCCFFVEFGLFNGFMVVIFDSLDYFPILRISPLYIFICEFSRLNREICSLLATNFRTHI